MSEPAATRIAGLRAQGADAFDRVRFHFIETLARRAATRAGATRRLLDLKIEQALTDYATRLARAQEEANAVLEAMTIRFPAAVDALRHLHGAGDFAGLGQLAQKLEARGDAASLAGLVRQLDAGFGATHAAGPTELKTVRRFRATWSRLSLERRLAHSHAGAVAQAGPLNSNVLALRALASMREISPDYFDHFMAYVDALLWLEQASGGAAGTPKNVLGNVGPPRPNRRRKQATG